MGVESRSEAGAARVACPGHSDEAAAVFQLRRELRETREQMQVVIELLQATNEALQSANEELLASNEELHRILDETETARQGLQAQIDQLTGARAAPEA